jgi:hypothetical protein
VTSADRWEPVVERYVVCGLPEGHRDWFHFSVAITRHNEDMWTVKARGTYQVSRDGVSQVMLDDDDWDPFVMPLQVAVEVATRYARTVTLRSLTADEIMRKENVNA